MACSAQGCSRSATPRARLPIQCRPRAARQPRRAVCARALKTTDGKLCVMRAQYEQLYRVADGPSFEAYLQVLESRLTRFELPLGASVDQLPNGQIVLQVPKVTFMDVYVYPTSTLEVQQRGGSTHVVAVDTSIDGSHHIKSLNCNDRFDLGLDVDLRAMDDIMLANAAFQLRVDVPFPLNLPPRGAMEATGNSACQRVLSSLMDTLCASIVRDHVQWMKEGRPGAAPAEIAAAREPALASV